MTTPNITIELEPRFCLQLTCSDLATLIQMARLHYDGECKRAATLGGFLYRWDHTVTEFNGFGCTATSRELQLTLKILEMRAALHTNKDRATADRLSAAIHAALNQWNAIYTTHTKKGAQECPPK